MKVAFTHYGVTHTVEVPSDELTLDDVMTLLIAPILLAAGYHPNNIDKLFKDGNPINWDTDYHREGAGR